VEKAISFALSVTAELKTSTQGEFAALPFCELSSMWAKTTPALFSWDLSTSEE
jgi:hypothetical protein